MRRTTLAAVLATGLLALAACTATTGNDPKTAPTASRTLTKFELRQACVHAVADVVDTRPEDFDPATDKDQKPAKCHTIPDTEYRSAYADGLKLSKERARTALGG